MNEKNFELKLLDTSENKVFTLSIFGRDDSSQNDIRVTSYDDVVIDEAKLFAAYEQAVNVRSEDDIAESLRAHEGTFNYELIDDENNVTYFYEEFPTGESEISIFKPVRYTDEEVVALGIRGEATAIPNSSGASQQVKGSVVRVRNHNTAPHMACRIQTPRENQIVGVNNTANEVYYYIYNGWSSNWGESDLGIQYSIRGTLRGWNHWFLMNNSNGSWVSGFDQVRNQNFFLTSTGATTRDINLISYRNFNGRVRSRADGFARFDNSDGNGNPSAFWLVSVKELQLGSPLNVVNSWKLVNDVATRRNVQGAQNARFRSMFSNITLGTAPLVRNDIASVVDTPASGANRVETNIAPPTGIVQTITATTIPIIP